MVRRICPICEQVMKGAHYCQGCHKFIRHPHVMNINYYLNEPRTKMEAAPVNHDPAAGQSVMAQFIDKAGSDSQAMEHQAAYRLNRAMQYRRFNLDKRSDRGGRGALMILFVIVVIMVMLTVGIRI